MNIFSTVFAPTSRRSSDRALQAGARPTQLNRKWTHPNNILLFVRRGPAGGGRSPPDCRGMLISMRWLPHPALHPPPAGRFFPFQLLRLGLCVRSKPLLPLSFPAPGDFFRTDAMSGCTPIGNENEDADFHGLRSQIFMNYPRSSSFVRVLFTDPMILFHAAFRKSLSVRRPKSSQVGSGQA